MITLFVDASHCPETHAAGWGAWAIQDGWEKGKVFGGRISKTVLNSSEAEVCAIVEAVRHLAARGLLKDNTLMVQSDSHRALQLFMMSLPHTKLRQHEDSKDWSEDTVIRPTPTEKWAIEMLTNNLGHFPFLYVRHIKGHASGEGRNWVNRRCDAVAREHMYKERQTRGGKAKKPNKDRFRRSAFRPEIER